MSKVRENASATEAIKTYQLVGDLVTRSEVTISTPEAMSCAELLRCQADRYIAQFPYEDAKSAKRTDQQKHGFLPRMPVPGSDGALTLVPYVPAASLRGAWRHRAARDLLYRIKARHPEIEIRIEDYLRLAVGGVLQRKPKGKRAQGKRENPKGYRPGDIARLRAANPYWSVWGAMLAGLTGKLAVEHAPYLGDAGEPGRTLMASGVRTDPFRREPDLLLEFADDDVRAWEERLAARREQAAAHEAAQAAQAAQAANADDAGNGLDNGDVEKPEVSLLMPLPGCEAIPRGVRLAGHHVTLYRATETELGILVRALRTWGEDPRIGGAKRLGYGRLAVSYEVRADGEPVGLIEIAGDGRVTMSGEALERAEAAWLAYPPDRLLASMRQVEDEHGAED